MKWRLAMLFGLIALGTAHAASDVRRLEILPDGTLQLDGINGPIFEQSQLKQEILKLKETRPLPTIDIRVRSQDSIQYMRAVLGAFSGAGYDMSKVQSNYDTTGMLPDTLGRRTPDVGAGLGDRRDQ